MTDSTAFVCYTLILIQIYPDLLQKAITVQTSLSCQVLRLRSFLRLSYVITFFYKNVRSLHEQFQFTSLQVHDILISCPSCHRVAPAPLAEGVNAQGLTDSSTWQTGVSHVAGFGCSKYVHVAVDIFSRFSVATAHIGEKAHDATRHWLMGFGILDFQTLLKWTMALLCF